MPPAWLPPLPQPGFPPHLPSPTKCPKPGVQSWGLNLQPPTGRIPPRLAQPAPVPQVWHRAPGGATTPRGLMRLVPVASGSVLGPSAPSWFCQGLYTLTLVGMACLGVAERESCLLKPALLLMGLGAAVWQLGRSLSPALPGHTLFQVGGAAWGAQAPQVGPS